MHMVVDSNQLKSSQLKAFLEASTANRAVLTDYSAMEALQGDAVMGICNAMRILADHPTQVIVLKHTQLICKLSGRAAGLRKRMVHNGQTAGFPEYIRKLYAAERGDQSLIAEIRKMAEDASQQLNRMLSDAPELAQSFDGLAVDFDKEERRKIRDGEPFTAKMVDTLIKAVMEVSITLFKSHPRSPQIPTYHELPNTFIFRNALCSYLLALEWAASGGAKTAKDLKIRNDMVDSHFVTHATYFDGLLTKDVKAMRLYKRAKEIMQAAFD